MVKALSQAATCNAVQGAEANSSNPKDDPVQIGFKQFDSAEAALKYFYDLVKCLRREQDINEVSFKLTWGLCVLDWHVNVVMLCWCKRMCTFLRSMQNGS